MEEITLDEKQLEAVTRCCKIEPTNRIVAVTGQAGTGKTTIMKQVYETLTNAGYAVMLCAPTGKAAKRIKEATGIEAVTIHRLLAYPHPGEVDEKTGKAKKLTVPQRDINYPLTMEPKNENHYRADVVLADEYAMVNNEVHRNLLDALAGGGFIRVFGDHNQLPPIETNKKLAAMPSPFERLLKKFDGIVLNKIHRQDEGSGIVTNGSRILKKQMPAKADDFSFRITDKPVAALEEYIHEARERGVDFSQPEYQIITPGNKGWTGTHKLNAKLQLLFRPESDQWIELERHEWDKKECGAFIRIRPGDKVIWTKNNYMLNIFNGETGIVLSTEPDINTFIVDWGDRITEIPPALPFKDQNGIERIMNPQKDCQLAYAVTTHKSQGSEFKEIVYVINKTHSFMLNHNNFYTAITRAKHRAHVIADQKGMWMSLQPPREKR